jgi:hypothetical protein
VKPPTPHILLPLSFVPPSAPKTLGVPCTHFHITLNWSCWLLLVLMSKLFSNEMLVEPV